MIIAEIIGGLGNQLFEYANAKALALKLNQELFFDLSFFDEYHRKDVYRLDEFNTTINVSESKYINKLKRKIIKPDLLRWGLKKLGASGFYSKSNHFDEHWFDINDINNLKRKKDLYISGYFDDQSYFENIKEILRQEFTLKNPLNNDNKNFQFLINDSKNSVGIHIRRGDYINNGYFAQLPISYYQTAVNYIESHYPESTYFIFSDDLLWVKKNFNLTPKTIFIDINDEATDFMELILMASCKHNIIANSTFSWWGAWLNNNPDKIVIAPKYWFKNPAAKAKYESGHLVPSNWKKI